MKNILFLLHHFALVTELKKKKTKLDSVLIKYATKSIYFHKFVF